MSNLPAKRERVWLVDERGSAIEKAAPPKTLTSGQRHYMYRLGLLAVDQFLRRHGFMPNAEESSVSFSYEKRVGGTYVWIDMKIKPPDNIAHVTSYPGYEYAQEAVGKAADGQVRYGVRAKVVTAKEVLGSDMLIQIMLSTNEGTRTPVFIPLPKDLDNPAQHVLRQVLGTLALACESIPKMREAFTEDEVKAAQNQAIDVETMPAHLLE